MPSTSSLRSFWPAFQKRWAAVLCEQTEGLDVWSEKMTQALQRGILEVPNSAEAHAALAQLNLRLSRLKSVRLASDEAFLDGATRSLFIDYGAAILSPPAQIARFPKLSSEGVLQYGELKLLVGELCGWLVSLKLAPRRVFSLNDFDSQILGRAVAHQLRVEFADGDGFTHSKSLIISADNRVLLDFPLRRVFPAQVLYSFNLHREGGGIVPDVAGISQDSLVLPWQQERLTSRKISNVVEHITTASTETSSSSEDWQSRLEFYRARRQLLTAGNSSYSRPSMLPELR